MAAAAADKFCEPLSDRTSRRISRCDLQILVREAQSAARRLVCSLRLPHHECDDLRQDLLLDLLARLKHFDPSRGSLGAFAGTVLRHYAGRLARRIRREGATFVPATLRDSSPDADEKLGDTLSDPSGYGAQRRVAEQFTTIENRLAIDQALGTLRASDIEVCAALMDATPTELSKSGTCSRASLYRQIREIRMRFLIAVVSTAA